MAYYVNKTDGTSILVLDGTKDTTSTSITLFGRLVQNYGDQQNENFVHMLENFAFTSEPAHPTTGQLWFDTNTNVNNALFLLKNYTKDDDFILYLSIVIIISRSTICNSTKCSLDEWISLE